MTRNHSQRGSLVQRVGSRIGALLRPRLSRQNASLQTATLSNPVPSPAVVDLPPAPSSPQPILGRRCTCRQTEVNKRGGPPSPGGAGICLCESMADGLLTPPESCTALPMSGSGASIFVCRPLESDDLPSPRRYRMGAKPMEELVLPEICIPINEISWGKGGNWTFSKKATKIIKMMIVAEEAGKSLDPISSAPQRPSFTERWMSYLLFRRKRRDRNRRQNRKEKEPGKNYLLPKWGDKRPKVSRSLWIQKTDLFGCFRWNDNDTLTIYSDSLSGILGKAALVIDKDDTLLQNASALMSWPEPGKIAIKKEDGDYDILINHLQRGRCIWVTRKEGGKSVIDIPRTEQLWDARTLFYSSHRHRNAHLPLTRFCQGARKIDWSPAVGCAANMARGKLAGALQALTDKVIDEREDDWQEQKTQLETIIRKRMVERSEWYHRETCDSCRFNRPGLSSKMRECSIEDGLTWTLECSEPEAECFLDDLERIAPPNLKPYTDRSKRKNKTPCLHGCFDKACTSTCAIEPSMPEPDIPQPDVLEPNIPKPAISKPPISYSPIPPGWALHCYDSTDSNKPSWNSFKCTENGCPKSFPLCDHAMYVKPGQSSRGDDDPFKNCHKLRGFVFWKDLQRYSFKEYESLNKEENEHRRKALQKDREKRYETFRIASGYLEELVVLEASKSATPSTTVSLAKPSTSKQSPWKRNAVLTESTAEHEARLRGLIKNYCPVLLEDLDSEKINTLAPLNLQATAKNEQQTPGLFTAIPAKASISGQSAANTERLSISNLLFLARLFK